ETFGERKAKVKNAREKFRKKRLAEAIEQAIWGDDASRTEQAEAVRGSTSNRLSPLMSVEDERAEREQAAASQVQPLRARLEQALRDFGKIPDPRRPRSIKHKLKTLLLYGLLSCVFQMASRREANRDMSRPAFLEALQGLFPELETLPHADTLARLLARIDPADLEKVHMELLRRYIRDKKFRRYLIKQVLSDRCGRHAKTGAGRFAVGRRVAGTAFRDQRRHQNPTIRLCIGSQSCVS
ncbi:MAG: transposase family protein, partial [Gammaproteobacteria bacterium]|nr:transposase family protein [Gammaproteobacteria bacterium]